MPFSFPRIDLRFNMSGIANSIKAKIGEVVQPMDLYEIYNTARDPDGLPYFKFVNDGTGPKHSGFTSTRASWLGPGVRSWKLSGKALSGRKKMTFFAGGRIIRRNMVAGNRPLKIRERTLPLVRKYFVSRVHEATLGVTEITTHRSVWIPTKGKGLVEYMGEYLEGYVTSGNLGASDKFGAEYWISIMEDTMEYAAAVMAKFTPVIKSEYYSAGYTPEPGLLKESYAWRRITGPGGGPTRTLNIESYSMLHDKKDRITSELAAIRVKSKRNRLIGSSKRRATKSSAGARKRAFLGIGKPQTGSRSGYSNTVAYKKGKK